MTDTTTLERARHALADHPWADAYEAFASAAADQAIAGEDLEKLAEAAWWTAHPAGVHRRSRARVRHATPAQGNPRRAAYVALHLADQWNERLQSAQAAGWLQRATRLLEGSPEGVEHGYLELALGEEQWQRRGVDAARDGDARHRHRASEIGTCRRSG